jgi:hypothetical protein
LIGYGAGLNGIFRQLSICAGKILKGAAGTTAGAAADDIRAGDPEDRRRGSCSLLAIDADACR